MLSRCLQCCLLSTCLLVPVVESAYLAEVLVGGAESLAGPMGVTMTPDGSLVVADTDRNRILKCPAWQLQGFTQQPCEIIAGDSAGNSGFQGSELRTPYVALPAQVSGSSFGVVIADTHNHRIQYWPGGASEGYTLAGGPGVGAPGYSGPTELEFPAGIALDEAAGYLYVSDTGRHRVVRYDLDVVNMRVVGSGETVAGSYGTSGTDESLLDNPTSLFLDSARDRLYVADARNSRVMLWLLSPNLLEAEGISTRQGVRRLASVDDDNETSDNETGTMTTTTTFRLTETSTSRTLTLTTASTTSTTSSTTATVYTGPRYQLFMSGLTGRPYGLFSQDDAVYVSDADGCTVWKKLLTGQTAVVVGGACGGSLAQLYFPAGIFVEMSGALLIADSRNNRILRFGPQPDSITDKCTLGGQCQLTLRNGLPTPRSRLVMVYSDFRSQCGGRCLASGLGGGSWVNVAPADKPHLNVMVFNFGVAGYGETMRDYILCFGPEPDEQQVNDGDCTTMPFNAGTVQMLPFLQADEDSLATECVSGTPCAIALSGYGIPSSIVVAAPPDSGAGTGAICGTGSNQNFQGFRSFVMSNPGVLLSIDEPFLAEGNRTATVNIDFGLALSLGSQLLCVCYQGNDCFAPTRFMEPAGYLRVRSALGGDTYYCRVGENCILNVTGRYLRAQDAAAITSVFLVSCSSLNLADSLQLPFESPVANASSTSPTSLWNNDGLGYALVDVGRSAADGRFQVCYCASYDGEDVDSTPCSSASEFTQSAGIVAMMRVNAQDYECPLGRNCSIVVSGLSMSASDSVLEAAGRGADACGSVVPQQAAVIGGVVFRANYFSAEAGSTSDTNQTQQFELGQFDAPGPRQVCYCSSFNEDPTGLYDSVQGACNDEGEFYQPVGMLTVRGPSAALKACPANLPCQVTISGVRLSAVDVIQVCPTPSSCGNTTACEAAGPLALGGLLYPAVASSTQTTFELGSIPLGSYALCYCAPGVNGIAEIPCSASSDLDMFAGELRVRGVQGGQTFECVENIRCEMDILGFDLFTSHSIIAIPLNGTCGSSQAVSELNVFNPNVLVTGQVGVGNTSTRLFVYDRVTVPERYRICYCLLPSCTSSSNFTEEVGVLIVKGVERGRYAMTCSLGERCGLTFNGSGMENGTDSIKLLPSGYPCGGAYLRVVGGDENGTADLNGIYERGSFFFNDRSFFVQRGGRNLVFYNNFRGWWVIYTELDTKEAPRLWADGTLALTPDRVDPGTWQVWIQDNKTVVGGGAWLPHPTLYVAGPVDENWAFGANPSSAMPSMTVDAVLGSPYLTTVTFDMGVASMAGTFKICWCPSWDWPSTDVTRGDVDLLLCSGDQEYFVNNGLLVVGYLTEQNRYHCLLDAANCSADMPLRADIMSRAVLFPGGTKCSEASFLLQSPWTSSRNISGAPSGGGNRTVFNFGTAAVTGEYAICVCTAFDDGADGLPCSRFSEFYEEGGSLTVAAEVGLTFEAGVYAVLNLTSGSGLDAADRLLFVPGSECNVSDEASVDTNMVTAPVSVSATGAWAANPVGAAPGPFLASGLYVACLCSAFDGPDTDQATCSTVGDFTSPMAKLQVTAVQGPQLSSSVSSSITIRLTMARRLTAVDFAAASVMFDLANAVESALGTALEASLQSSPVSVEVTGVSPMRDTNATIDVTVNFTATLSAPADQHLLPIRAFDNATCPSALLEPPWETDVEVPPDAPLLLGCLRLAQVLIFDSASGSPIQSIVTMALSTASLSGVVGTPTVVGLGDVQAPVLGYQPVSFSCVRGADCPIRIAAANGTGAIPAGAGSLLVIAGVATCGSTSLQDLATLPRAASGVLDSNPVNASSPSATSLRIVSIGEPKLQGSYTLCFCAGSDSGSGACALDRDFFSLVGSLTVRGPAFDNNLYCVVYANCSLALRGIGLSVFDWILVREGSGSCFDSGRVGFQASDKFLINPAGLPQEDVEQQWIFDLGTATQTGQYQLCYCASHKAQPGSSAAPCQAPADFTMQVGSLYVRGIQNSGFSYGCVKSSKGDAEASCTLPVEGTGLIPEQDKMLLIPMTNGSDCGEVAASRAFGISPNPIPLGLGNSTVFPVAAVNATDVAQWVVQRADTPGLLRVCYCADSADGSLDGFGLCSSPSGFYWEVGSLVIRGADIGQMYVCAPGNPCQVSVRGTALSIRDKVRLVGPEDSCSLSSLRVKATEQDFVPAVEANETVARFDLGSILFFEPTDPVALRLCYCADFNADSQNDSCTSPDDFTHSAGVVNIADCPAPPSEPILTPLVEDVYGDPGDSKVRLYLLPEWTCVDLDSRTATDLDLYQDQLPLGPGYGIENKGGSIYSKDVVLSTRNRQCVPGITAKTGRLQNLNFSQLDLSITGGQPTASSSGLPIEAGFYVRGVSSISDLQGNANMCPVWQVQIIAYACTWDATLLFGALLHISILVVILWTCLSNQLFYCSAFCKFVKQVDPIVESEEQQQDDADALRPHAAVAAPAATPGTPSLKALAAGGASADEPDQPLKVLASARSAIILALLRCGALGFHLMLILGSETVGDTMLLYVVPLALAATNIIAQLALLGAVWGRKRLRTALRRPQHLLHSFTITLKLHLDLAVPVLARRHHSELWRVSAILVTLELLVQVAYPVVLLLRGLCPGRLAATSTAVNRARALLWNPRPSLPEGLEEVQVDVKDEKVQAMLEEHAHVPSRRGSMSSMATPKSTIEALSLDKIPQGVSVHHGRIGLRGIESDRVSVPGARPAGPAGRRMSQVGSGGRRMSQVGSGGAAGRRMSQVGSGGMAGRRMSQAASGGVPSRRGRPPRRQSVEFMSGLQLEERSPSYGRGGASRRGRRDAVGLFAPPALAYDDRAPTKGSMESMASSMTSKAEQIQKEELILHMFRMKALEKHLATRRARCCPRCGNCCLIFAFPCIWLWRQFQKFLWIVATLLSSYEPEHPEEFRRRRIVGLWSFLDGSGWYVASVAFRRHAENAGGFQLPHFEDRPALISAFVGGFDMAVLCLALLSFYLPRLDPGEMGFLSLAIFTTLLQVGRPGIFKAAQAAADDLFIDPAGLFYMLLVFILLRAVMLAVIGLGCAVWTWLGYLIWSCSTVLLEGPVLLFCWRSWPIIWNIVSGEKAPWPSSIGRMFGDFYDLFIPARIKESRDKSLPWKPRQDKARINSPQEAPTVPMGSRVAGMTRALDGEGSVAAPSVREAALAVLAYRKDQGSRPAELEFIEAEPCLAALCQLVEDIMFGVPQDLSAKIIDNPHGEVARLHRLFANLNRRPPRKHDRSRRVRRLLGAMVEVEKLATLCQYMGPWTRLSYDELRAQILEELWLSRSMVKMHKLLCQPHFRYGSLGSRARLLEALVPSAPRLWLVSARTLQRLGRLPKQREFDQLTLASDAHKAHGSKAVVLIAVHRWRSQETPDPHRVTWRQLQAFARWYRWRWGPELEVYFWIDYCCVPEIRGQLPEKVVASKQDIWEEPEALLDSLAQPSPQNRRCSFANLMDKRGLSNLAAWSEATGNALDDEDRAQEEPEQVDQPFLDLVAAGRKEDADMAGFDAIFPAIFAAADGLVLCTSHAFEEDAWCRMYLSLGYAFLPTGRLMYEVDRNLVHVSRDLRQRRPAKASSQPPAKGHEDTLLPGQLKLEDAQPPPMQTDSKGASNEMPALNAPDAGNVSVADTRMQLAKLPPTQTVSKGSEDSKAVVALPVVPGKPDRAFDEECLQRFLSNIEAFNYEMLLPDPTEWEKVLVEDDSDMGRVQRLTTAALDLPTLATDTDFRRAPLVYGETRALVCCLRGPKRMRKKESSVRTTQEEESSSDSECDAAFSNANEELPAPSAATLREAATVPFTYMEKAANWDDKMLELYFGASNEKKREEAQRQLEKESLATRLFPHIGRVPTNQARNSQMTNEGDALFELGDAELAKKPQLNEPPPKPATSLGTSVTSFFSASSSTLKRSLQPPPNRPTLAGNWAPSVLRFHEGFVSKAVSIGPRGKTASRIREKNVYLPFGSVGSGGLALLSQPLVPRSNVCPDAKLASGVTFDLVIEETDFAYHEGLGTGFTAQVPEEWPSHRRLPPQSAIEMPRTCVVGYDGKWFTSGHSELIQGAWNPGKMQRGDVVTAVLAGPPANLVRVLVNGKVVAQRPLSETGLAGENLSRLWGVVDLEGSCEKVRLGTTLPP